MRRGTLRRAISARLLSRVQALACRAALRTLAHALPARRTSTSGAAFRPWREIRRAEPVTRFCDFLRTHRLNINLYRGTSSQYSVPELNTVFGPAARNLIYRSKALERPASFSFLCTESAPRSSRQPVAPARQRFTAACDNRHSIRQPFIW